MNTSGSNNADFGDVSGSANSRAASSSSSSADFSDVKAGASSTAPADSATGGRTYTVKSGDNLRKIATHFYGDEMKWHKIRDANRSLLPSPDNIQVGVTLRIPDA
ncbi:MAG: LysM peptidoglycan-binding domain-containing protein [Gemmatimonadota bacterium]|nr:LysM peptidoglycan-binding domain-containing protein [Gemmatimonadota bacterium]